jgi:hypothetical protein
MSEPQSSISVGPEIGVVSETNSLSIICTKTCHLHSLPVNCANSWRFAKLCIGEWCRLLHDRFVIIRWRAASRRLTQMHSAGVCHVNKICTPSSVECLADSCVSWYEGLSSIAFSSKSAIRQIYQITFSQCSSLRSIDPWISRRPLPLI